jgi:hypothetical protein
MSPHFLLYTLMSEIKAEDMACVLHQVRFEVFTAVTMNNDIFWDVKPCGSCKNRRFGGTYRIHQTGEKNQRAMNGSSN